MVTSEAPREDDPAIRDLALLLLHMLFEHHATWPRLELTYRATSATVVHVEKGDPGKHIVVMNPPLKFRHALIARLMRMAGLTPEACNLEAGVRGGIVLKHAASDDVHLFDVRFLRAPVEREGESTPSPVDVITIEYCDPTDKIDPKVVEGILDRAQRRATGGDDPES